MLRTEFRPATEWVTNLGSDHHLLLDPGGGPYDPTRIPPWMDPTGIRFLATHAERIHLWLLHGRQASDEDLGKPRFLEQLARTATLVGDASVAGPNGPDRSYHERWSGAFAQTSARHFEPVTSINVADGRAVHHIQETGLMWGSGEGVPPATQNDDELPCSARAIELATAAHTLAAVGWLMLSNAGYECAAADTGGEHNVVLSLGMFDSAVGSLARNLMRDVRQFELNREAWDPIATVNSEILKTAITTGVFGPDELKHYQP